MTQDLAFSCTRFEMILVHFSYNW